MATHVQNLTSTPFSRGHYTPHTQKDSPPKFPSVRGTSKVKRRISHACDRCRMMRTKCSGGEQCSKCIKDNANCVYGDRKRERNKKDLAESLDRIDLLEIENARLLNALRALSERPEFRPAEHREVMEILARYSGDDESPRGHESSIESQSQTSPASTQIDSRTAMHTWGPGKIFSEDAKAASNSGYAGK